MHATLFFIEQQSKYLNYSGFITPEPKVYHTRLPHCDQTTDRGWKQDHRPPLSVLTGEQ